MTSDPDQTIGGDLRKLEKWRNELGVSTLRSADQNSSITVWVLIVVAFAAVAVLVCLC